MFGIKTLIREVVTRRKHRLTNDTLIRGLMNHFKADECGHRADIDFADLGYGWIHYGLVRCQKPNRILAIGSGYGYIPSLLAQACHDNGIGHVDFVDAGYGLELRHAGAWVGFWKTIEGQSIFQTFEMGSLKKRITLYNMRTEEFFKKYDNLVYDYIYIDGDHLYKGIKFDVDHALPLLSKGGFLVLHDISILEKQAEGKYGVERVWKEIAKKNYLEFNHPVSGLGILQKQ